MTTTINNEHKKLNVPNKREQNQTCLDSAECEGLRPKGNVPNLRFPEFEGEWRRSKFKKVITLQRGSSPRPIIKYITTSTDGVNWIKIGDMPHFGRIVTSTEEKITREGAKKSRLVKKGDLILSNSMSYGLPYIMGVDGYIHDGWFVLKDFEDTFDKDYLCNLLISSAIQNQYKRLAAGGVVQNISSDLVNSVSVSIPLMEEQKKISSLLNLIDDRIATQNKIIEDLKKLKCAIIDYTIDAIQTDYMEFSEVYDMAGEGGTPSTSNMEYYKNGCVPFIKIEDLKQKYLVSNKDYITELGLHKSSAWLIPANSILFSNGATIGEISITTYPVCTKQGILGIVPKADIDTEYLYYLMSSRYFKKEICRIITEGTMKTAYLKDINKIRCPIPSKAVQQEIVRIPSALNTKIEIEQCVLDKLICQKQYLLRQMFI